MLSRISWMQTNSFLIKQHHAVVAALLQASTSEDFITSKLHPKEVLLTGYVRMRWHLNVERLFYYVAVNFMK